MIVEVQDFNFFSGNGAEEVSCKSFRSESRHWVDESNKSRIATLCSLKCHNAHRNTDLRSQYHLPSQWISNIYYIYVYLIHFNFTLDYVHPKGAFYFSNLNLALAFEGSFSTQHHIQHNSSRFPCIWSIHSGGNSIFQRRICWNHLKLRIDIHIFYIELRLMRFMWLLPRQSLRQPQNYRWICKTAGYPSDCPHKSYCICGTYVHLNSNFMWPTRVWPLLNTVGPGVLSAP